MEKQPNIWELIKRRAGTYGEKTAFVCGGARISYANLVERVERGGPPDRKIQPVCRGGMLAQAVSILRGLRQNRIVVPLNLAYGERYCQGILAALKACPAERVDEDIALILFTSGSTGKPKGVMLSHENIIENILAVESYFKVNQSDKILIARPLAHSSVLTGELLFSLYRGLGIHLLSESFVPQRLARYLCEHKITTFGCTPTMLRLLLPALQKTAGAGLKNLVISGEILSRETAISLADTLPGLNVYSVYGLTEASPRVSALLPEEFERKPGSIGKAIRGVKMRLKGEKKDEKEGGVTGRLEVKSRGVMRGYLGDKAMTDKKISGGWLDTGDVARRDQGGYYYILGRADNMIIRGGINLYPEEMERLVKADPRIREAVFSSQEHGILGNLLCLQVAADLTEEEVFAICKSRLPTFAQPQRIETVRQCETTPGGKLRRGRRQEAGG